MLPIGTMLAVIPIFHKLNPKRRKKKADHKNKTMFKLFLRIDKYMSLGCKSKCDRDLDTGIICIR